MAIKVIDKASQQEIEVSSKEAEQGLLSGNFVLPDAEVQVTRGGKVGKVATSDLATALGQGARIVDTEEARQLRIAREESDTASQILGGAEAIAAGATLGASTWVERELGGNTARMRARREALGSLGTGLELTGAAVPALFTGGSSAGLQGAGRAASVATNLSTRGVARAGVAVERGLGRVLAEAPSIVRTTVPVAGRGAVEGFAASAGAEVDESVLGDRELSAERLIQEGAFGALFGAGAGTVVPLLASSGAGLARVGTAPIRRVLGKAAGIADGDGSSLVAKIASDDNLARLASINGGGDDFVRMARMARDNPAYMDDLLNGPARLTEEIAGDLGVPAADLRAAVSSFRREMTGTSKLRQVERLLPTGPDSHVAAHSAALGVLDDIDNALTSGAVLDSQAKLIRSLTQHARKEIADVAAQAGTGRVGYRRIAAQSNRSLDLAKQHLFQIRTNVRQAAKMGNLDAMGSRDAVDNIYSSLASHLEDEAVWGAAGAAQKAINTTARAAAQARKALGNTASARILDAEKVLDNADLLSVARNSGRFAGSTKTELLEDAIAREVEWGRTMAKHFELSPKQAQQLAALEEAQKKIGKAFERQRDKVTDLDMLERLRTAETGRSPSNNLLTSAAPTMLGLAGFGVAGIPGAIAGGVLGAATKPYTTIRHLRQLAAIEQKLGTAGRARVRAVAKFLGQGADTVAAGVEEAAQAVGSGARTVATFGAGRAANRRERVDTARDRIISLATQPALLEAEVSKMITGLDDAAPQLAAAVARKVTVASQFLADKAPATYQAPFSSSKPLVDEIELSKFERYLDAVSHPIPTLERLASGTFTAEHAEAFRVVYPSEYRELQREVMDQLADMQKAGKSIPLSKATTLSIVMQIPADPTLSQATQIATAMSPMPRQQQQPNGAAPMKPSRDFEIDDDRYASATSGIGEYEG